MQTKSIQNVTFVEGPKLWYFPTDLDSGLCAFYKHGLNLIPAWISNHMHSKVWDEIISRFSKFNDCTVEVWEWIRYFIQHFIMIVITYPCWDKVTPCYL